MERACAVCLAVWLWARLPRARRTPHRPGRARAARARAVGQALALRAGAMWLGRSFRPWLV